MPMPGCLRTEESLCFSWRVRAPQGCQGCHSGCVALGLLPTPHPLCLCSFRAAMGTLLVPGTAPEPSTAPAQNSLGFPKTSIPQLPSLADSSPQGPQAFPPQGPKFLLVMRNQLGLDAGGSLSGGWGSCLAQTSFPQSSTASNTHLDAMSGLQLTLGELGFIAAIQV